ncbi:Hypothetical protein NTJ_08107 [Nesidiocoris tenuis]|uniref:Uncharacterized protein n=1 Tax=Nesidiocoris tenuis TaxID=355587 RepID=A0ABN7AV79_9HEMI|nr:Hypothetical protein NTJ_08107 [Nesidiocoris tenuis]
MHFSLLRMSASLSDIGFLADMDERAHGVYERHVYVDVYDSELKSRKVSERRNLLPRVLFRRFRCRF